MSCQRDPRHFYGREAIPRQSGLVQICEQLVVFGVSADEKPDDIGIAFSNADGAIGIADPNGPERQGGMEAFELKAGVRWIDLKSAVGFSGSFLNVAGQRREAPSE